MQTQQPVPGDLVVRVVEQARRHDEILDVGRLEEPQAPVLAVRDLARRELHFDQVAVMGGPYQHRLLVQRRAAFVGFEDVLDHGRRLGGGVVAMHQGGLEAAPPLGEQPEVDGRGPRSGPSPWGRTALATSRIPWRDRKLRCKLDHRGVREVQDQLAQMAEIGAPESRIWPEPRRPRP